MSVARSHKPWIQARLAAEFVAEEFFDTEQLEHCINREKMVIDYEGLVAKRLNDAWGDFMMSPFKYLEIW